MGSIAAAIEAHDAIVDDHVLVARRDVDDAAGQRRTIGGLQHGETRAAAEHLSQARLVKRAAVQHNHHRRREIGGQLLKQINDGLDASGRRADGDDISHETFRVDRGDAHGSWARRCV